MSELEQEDGASDVLAHGRDICEFRLCVREYAVPVGGIGGQFLQARCTSAPQTERLQEFAKFKFFGLRDFFPVG